MSLRLDMWYVILLVSVCGLVHGLSTANPLVSTKVGKIRGLRSDQGFAKFLGVPYAVVNKANPFGRSVPHPGFDDIFEAYESNECPQVNNNVASGTLDCLTINIYVPNIANSQNRLPVMVWIHGGAFVIGSAEADGSKDFLMKNNDVIVVEFNYRLGIYGFMCLDIPEVSGNQALMDQMLALRWINDNIEAFGGNASDITVFGESGGGVFINLHLLSAYEKLFHKAIIMSGPAISPWMITTPDNRIPFEIAAALDFNTEDIVKALNYLATIDAQTLVKLTSDLKITSSIGYDTPRTTTCVEKKLDGVEQFMTEHPINIISDKVRTTPILIGITNNELAFRYGYAGADFFANYNFGTIRAVFDLGDNFEDAIEDVRHFYIGDEKTSENVRDELTDFSSDFVFNHPTQRMAKRLLDIGATTIYQYVFSYSGDRNVIKIKLNLNSTGALHGDELGYLFDDEIFKGKLITPEDQLMIDRMTTLWINFAKYGDPTPETSELIPVKLQPITNTTQPYLNIDSDLTVGNRPFQKRMAFWDVFFKLYRDQQRWYEVPGKSSSSWTYPNIFGIGAACFLLSFINGHLGIHSI